MKRLSLFVLALLIAAPAALAQVTQPPTDQQQPPQQHDQQMQDQPQQDQQMQQHDQQRADLQQRMDRLDRHYEALGQRTQAVPQQQRADFDRQMGDFRQQRDQLRTDWQQMQDVPQDQWADQHRAFEQRLMQLETGAQRTGDLAGVPFQRQDGQQQTGQQPPAQQQPAQQPGQQQAQATRQNGQLPPPTQARMQEYRTDVQQRMQRLDRDLQDFERRTQRMTDAQQRTAAQEQLTGFRQQYQTIADDGRQLETATADAFRDAHRQQTERLGTFERELYEARLGTARDWNDFRTMSRAHLDRQREAIDLHARHLGDVHDERRAEAAYELIQLRTRFDDLDRRNRAMTRADQAAFANQRTAYTQDLLALDDHLGQTQRSMQAFRHGMTPDMLTGHTTTGGTR